MNKNLFAYKAGLGIVGVFVIIMAIFVIMQANGTKQDSATDKAANKIAGKLNTYIETNQVIPDSLTVTGVKVPSSITYNKLDSGSYKFCATYKANSSGFDATGAVLDAASGSSADTGSGSDTSYTKYSLYIDSTHHKGENCQTIKPLIYQNNPLKCHSTYQSQISIACPATSPSIYTPATNSSALCAYDSAVVNGCKQECTVQTQNAVLRVVFGQVTKVSASGNFNLTIKDTKGYTHVVMFQAAGNVFDGNCTGSETSAIHVGDKLRIVVAGVNGQRVTVGDGDDNITATEIDDYSN